MPAHARLAIVALVASSHAALAGIVHDEATDGDLSGDRLAPTALTLGPGSNTLRATVSPGDLDYFTFTIAPGQRLDAIVVDAFSTIGDVAFLGVQQGTVFTEPAGLADVANLLGYTHFGITGDIGRNILPRIGTGNGAIGFTDTLPAGDYVFWMQQQGKPSPVTLDFVVTPAPPTALALAGFALVASRRRR
ncbi:MAG: hypothetical protein DHS20C14_02300 [Phycisphaeraceae bacterium]|nr:MAG: hypothetical protein DHS20C14_02300 [Phycisphaeraceae bacterium]